MITKLVVLQPINLCNLNCSYCYVPGRRDPKMMSGEIAEASIRSVLNSNMVEGPLTFVWHAGEPLAAGIDYYKKCIDYIEKYNTKGVKLTLSIQTNATLINQKWCDFFKQHKFEVGVSIDGPEFIHDKFRVNWKGKGSFSSAMKGVENLRKNSFPLSSICVLTDYSLDYPHEIYNFFKENDFKALSLNIEEIECLNQSSSYVPETGKLVPQRIIDRYKNFMSIMFDLWDKDGRNIQIREFNETIKSITLKKLNPQQHAGSMETLAFCIVTITKDGYVSTFSPEFAGGTTDDPKKFFIGNVLNINSLDDLIEDANFQKQLAGVKKGIKNCANECAYFDVCGGGSTSNKFYERGSFEATETTLCVLTKKTLTDLIIEKCSIPKLSTVSSPSYA